MTIPKSVKIGGITYEVNEVERLREDANCAEIYFRDARIEIKKGINLQVANRCFLHEVIHGIRSELGYSTCNNDEKETDELAGALYALIVDNPEIFK